MENEEGNEMKKENVKKENSKNEILKRSTDEMEEDEERPLAKKDSNTQKKIPQPIHKKIISSPQGSGDEYTEEVYNEETKKIGGKPICKYGKDCYRKNQSHFQEFAHPP